MSQQPFSLPYFLKRFEKRYFLISEGYLPERYLLWQFRENLQNGNLVQYELTGKALTVGDAQEASRAYLIAKLICKDEVTKVVIQDIVTSLTGRYIGTFIMNTFIEFIRDWDSLFSINEIKGELSTVDNDINNKERRDAFYRNFGFTLKEENGLRYIVATKVEQLHTRPLKGIKCLSMNDVHGVVAQNII